jgi:hypothetical protein
VTEGLPVGGLGALDGATDLVGAGVLTVGEADGLTVISTSVKQKPHATGHASLTGLPLFHLSQYLLVLTPSFPP